jgi:NAD(P)-dependent dehydrogenase (short-subunit alcohol dehydrogenase family)
MLQISRALARPTLEPLRCISLSKRTITSTSLAGKKCIITGASRGIGLAIAQRFAAEGAACTLIGRNKDTLEDVMNSLSPVTENHGGSHVHSVRAGDVGERKFWEEIAREMVCVFGFYPIPVKFMCIVKIDC